MPEIALIASMIGILWLGITLSLIQQRRDAVAGAYRDTASLARAFDEGTKRIIGQADQTLLSVRAFYASQGAHFDLRAWAASQTAPNGLMPQVALIDARGILIDSTLLAHPKPIDLSDRPHFIAQRDSYADRLYISVPVLGRVSGRYTIQATRKLFGPKGAFAGVAVVSIDVNALSAFYGSLETPGMIALVRSNGVILARGPPRAGTLGQNISGRSYFQTMARQHAGSFLLQQGPAHAARYVSYRHVRGYPLIVMVGFDRHNVLRIFRLQRQRWTIAGGLLTALLLVVAVLWIRQRRRSVASRRALVATLQAVNQGILMIDRDGRVPVINQRAREFLGLPLTNEQGPTAWWQFIHRLWQPDPIAGPDILSRPTAAHDPVGGSDRAIHDPAATDAPGAGLPREWHRANGQVIEVARFPVPAGGMVETFTDVTADRAALEQIRHLAHHDGLTGLPNRLLLRETLRRRVLEAPAKPPVLLFVDLDGFKQVNDTLGHTTGDLVLIEVASRLKRVAGPDAMVARMGGDEFVLLPPHTTRDPFALDLAQRAIQLLSHPIWVGHHKVRISACVGITDGIGAGGDPDELLRSADIALYHAKTDGPGTVRRFTPWMVVEIESRAALEADLRAAIETGAIDVVFEAQVNADTMVPVAFEALARWRHKTRGDVPPGVFIPLAEECGLIHALGAALLRRACEVAVSWPHHCRLAVNLSPAQLQEPDLPSLVRDILAATGLPADRLELEITEGVLISEEQPVFEALWALRRMGVRLVLDDFGTGYSSLSNLLSVPVDRLKIDRAFVQRGEGDQAARAIIQAVIAMATKLELDLTAEGVETEQQMRMLRALGCVEMQGWLFARAMPAATITATYWPQRALSEP